MGPQPPPRTEGRLGSDRPVQTEGAREASLGAREAHVLFFFGFQFLDRVGLSMLWADVCFI